MRTKAQNSTGKTSLVWLYPDPVNLPAFESLVLQDILGVDAEQALELLATASREGRVLLPCPVDADFLQTALALESFGLWVEVSGQ